MLSIQPADLFILATMDFFAITGDYNLPGVVVVVVTMVTPIPVSRVMIGIIMASIDNVNCVFQLRK